MDQKTRRLLRAAKNVLRGLNARIDQAGPHAVPVFDGIVDLSSAIHAFKPTPDPLPRMSAATPEQRG